MGVKLRGKRRSRGSAVQASSHVHAKLVRIGNSRGIRLPKALLDQTGLGEEVTLRVEGQRIIVEAAKNPRAGWDEAMRQAAAEDGGRLSDEDREWLDAPLSSDADEKDWTW